MLENSRLSAVNSAPEFLALPPSILARRTRIHPIESPVLEECGCSLSVMRLDELHPELGGNKCFKLYHHLKRYVDGACTQPLASFGGAYSNHLYALAALGKQTGLPTLGIVRGNENEPLTPTLADLQAMGMRLHRVSRTAYRQRYDLAWLAQLESQLGALFWVPEGGGGVEGVRGCAALGEAIVATTGQSPFSHVAVACGTASTLAGILAGLSGSQLHVVGFSALKGAADELKHNVDEYLRSYFGQRDVNTPQWHINEDFHCGGFGRMSNQLAQFVSEFECRTRVLLDPVYTAKLMYGIEQLARKGFWPEGSRILAIHTGGLQGRRGHTLDPLATK